MAEAVQQRAHPCARSQERDAVPVHQGARREEAGPGWLCGTHGSSREDFSRAIRMSSCHAPALGLAPVGLGTGSLHAQ